VAAMGRERFNGFGYQADNSKRIRPGQPSQKDNMMNKTFSRISILFVSSVLLAALPLAAADAKLSNIERQVRHELVMLPYYGVFDNFTFRVDGSKVTLMGEVTRPTLKTSAEKVVAQLEGVEKVDNRIKVLPVSPNDDRVRVAVYRAIYYHPSFTRYAIRSVPPIHIIVNNGDVALEGVVATKFDKDVANIQANGVSGVFSVTNNLRVESEE
jgi:hyperosmotically inducible protein